MSINTESRSFVNNTLNINPEQPTQLQQEQQQTIENFEKELSFKAAHTTHITGVPVETPNGTGMLFLDTTLRKFTTDVEVDDIIHFRMLILSMQEHFLATGEIPQWNIVLSQGNYETLLEKEATLKIIASHAVATGLLDPQIAKAFKFFYEPPSTPDPDKVHGYHNIFMSYIPLMEGREAFMEDLFPTTGTPVKDLHAHIRHTYDILKAQGRQSEMNIHDICIAPVHHSIEFYSSEEERTYNIFMRIYGGNFNINAAITQSGNPNFGRIIEDTLNNKVKSTVVFEGFLAARVEQEDNKGEVVRKTVRDFNRISSIDNPDIFENVAKTAFGQATLNAIIGWNKPNYDKWCKDIEKMLGKPFLEELQAAQTRGEAVESYHKAFTNAIDNPQLTEKAKQALVDAKNKGEFKSTLVQVLAVSKLIQCVIADPWVSAICWKPTLINPDCIQKSTIALRGKGNNTVFLQNPEGRVYGIQNKSQGPNQWRKQALDFASTLNMIRTAIAGQ